jgi:membrane-associated phospholipid phosphatase
LTARSRDIVNSSRPASDDVAASQRGAPIVAVLCAIALVVLASMVGSGPLPIDVAIRNALHVGDPVPLPLDVLNVIGGALVWDPLVVVLVVALWLGSRRAEAIWIGAGVLVAETLATATKLIVDRPRPPGIAVIDLVSQASFPSGHVTRVVVTGALVALLWRTGRRNWIVATVLVVVLGIAIGLARILAGEHWPTDVAGGYLLAGSVIAGTVAARGRLSGRGPAHPPQPAHASDDEARPP